MKSRARDNKAGQQRLRLANDIARLMWEYRIEDFKLAKEKAIKKFGLRHAELPDNQLISSALNAYSELFDANGVHQERIQRLRLAKDLMRLLAAFDPRAVGLESGAVVTPGGVLKLHVFSEPPEAFDLYLQEHGIEYRLEDKRFRFGAEEYDVRPSYSFEYQGQKICISVFPVVARNRVPLSPVDGRPMVRTSLRVIDELMDGL